jgi:hypothetical protein
MITLSTIVYEGNFDKVLSDDCWFMKFKSPLISDKIIVVNNLISKERFLEKVNDLMNRHNFEVIYVDELKDLAIAKYKLGVNESTRGYYYTISYFCLFEKVKSKYVLNIASDCMDDIKITDTFLSTAMYELDTNEFCSTAMVAWTKDNYIMANKVTIGRHENYETFRTLGRKYMESENFNYSFGFTDQFFMGDVEKLKVIDYNVPESVSEQIYHGPEYGGNSFEKRMVGHQIQNNIYNCIYKDNDYYIHDNNYY